MPMKVILGLSAAILVPIAALGILLPWVIESDSVQTSLREKIESALGDSANVEWQGAEAPPFSLRLMLHRPMLVLGNEESDRQTSHLRWTAASGEARLSLDSLLRGRIELSSLALSEGDLEVQDRWRLRTILWRFEDVDLASDRSQASEPFWLHASGRITSGPLRDLAVRAEGTLTSRGVGDLTLHLDSFELGPQLGVDPGGESAASGVKGRGSLHARRSSDKAMSLDASLDLGPRGRLDVAATRATAGSTNINPRDATGRTERLDAGGAADSGERFDVHVDFEALDLALAKLLFPDLRITVAGFASGEAEFIGDASSRDRIDLDLRVRDGRLRMPEYIVEGSVPARARIEDPFSDRPTGQFELDLTDARFEYREGFEKPAGMGATVTTTFSRGKAGPFEFESRVVLHELDQIFSREGLQRFLE